MEQVPGAFGTSASLALRFGQTLFSSASLLFMCFQVEFYSYTAFSYLVTVMGLVAPWSFLLALVDAYSVFIRCLTRQQRVVSIIVMGDFVLSFLSLAAASSTASVTSILHEAGPLYCPVPICSRFELSAAMAFLSWFLSFSSVLFNLWLLPSL
ncbi:hypothetical protein SLEP1_g8090 [Rubroshorea leprosula]|uniref:CASP-like protein n=1 Tax=Rubroshorea leprosula TaxID=152421 RepID=A0AAV5I0G8_9ROSI|nr:hypothetical protein SLEP1_g8090 [Rubroshorea leprosula]